MPNRRAHTKRSGVQMCHADWIIRVLLTRTVATGAILLGIAFNLGGYERISGPSFGTIARLPWAPASWGVPLAMVGTAALIMALQPLTLDRRGRIERGVLQVCLFGISVWNLCFAIAFVVDIFRVPMAAISGPFICGLNAAVCLILAVGHRTWDQHAG